MVLFSPQTLLVISLNIISIAPEMHSLRGDAANNALNDNDKFHVVEMSSTFKYSDPGDAWECPTVCR